MNKYKGDIARSFQRKRLENGEWPFGPLFGYKRVLSHYQEVLWKNMNKVRIRSVKKYKIIPDENEIKILLDIFLNYASNLYSLDSLSEYIEKKYTLKLSIQTLDKILKNRFYIGEMHALGQIYHHTLETPITREVFDKVQRVKENNTVRKVKYLDILPYAYRGLIYCYKHTTRILSPEKHKEYIYYSCGMCKPKISVNEKILSQCFVSFLDQIVINESYLKSLPENLQDKLLVFKQNMTSWFLANQFQRKYIILLLFREIFWDTNKINLIINAPFNNENYQDFLWSDIDRILTIFNYKISSEVVIKSTDSATQILLLLETKKFTNELLELLDISLVELSNILLDLQLSGKIDQDYFGYWKLK